MRNVLKKVVALSLLACMILSVMPVAQVQAAKEPAITALTLGLNSNVVEDKTITLYERKEEYYIWVDDLCRLTRTEKISEDGGVTLKQGIWTAQIDLKQGALIDPTQQAEITLLNQDGKLLVPAMMLLSYFKSVAFVQDKVLYCRMPQQTAWEILDTDLSETVNHYLPDEADMERKLMLDILKGMINPKGQDEDVLTGAALQAAMNVDLYDLEALKQGNQQELAELYEEMNSDSGLQFLAALRKRFASMEDTAGWYVDFYRGNTGADFTYFAYGGTEDERLYDSDRFSQTLTKAFRKTYNQEGKEFYFTDGDYALLFRSAAELSGHKLAYAQAAPELVSAVFTEEHFRALDLEPEEKWTKAAENFTYSQAMGAEELADEIESLFLDAQNWDSLSGAELSDGKSIVAAVYGADEKVATALAGKYGAAPGAYELGSAADRVLCLSELQQSLYRMLEASKKELKENTQYYEQYLDTLQLYCRVSLALYTQAANHYGEESEKKAALQQQIDLLSKVLYQTTKLAEAGAGEYQPLVAEKFYLDGVRNRNRYIAYYRELMDGYYDTISGSWYNKDNGASDLFYEYDRCTLYNTGYAFIDLDQNGMPELIITEVDAGREGEIYDMYTIHQGQVRHLVSGSKRDRYYLTGFNSVINQGSSGAGLSLDIIFWLDGAEGMLKVHRALCYDYDADPDDPWFYCEKQTSNQDPYEYIEQKRYAITEEQAEEVMDNLPVFKWITTTRFQDYPRYN